MARIKKLLLASIGVAGVAAAISALRNTRAVPLPGAVPPAPPSRPPQLPTLDEAPRPASGPARPQVSEQTTQRSTEPNYSEMGKDQLYAEARRRDLPGRSTMSKEELAQALSEM